MVNVRNVLLGGGPFFFVDFNGNRLDLANNVASDLNPIITFPADQPGIDTNQKVRVNSLWISFDAKSHISGY